MCLFAFTLGSSSGPMTCVFGGSLAGVVQGGALSSICAQILAMVNQEQNKVLWIPASPL